MDRIMRVIRASSHPFHGAYTTFKGRQKVRIWRAEPFEHRGEFLAIPGQVCFPFNGDPIVACGDGMIKLTEINVDGIETDISKTTILSSLRNRLV